MGGREREEEEGDGEGERESESERERAREKHQCKRETATGCLLICTPTGDQTCNLGMCPGWELNLQPFGLYDNTPTN